MSELTTQIIGYMAPALLAASFLFKNVTTIRWVNSAGCMLFTIYGCRVGAYPVVVGNILIFGINMYQLWRKR